jgi:UDP-N-acetylglucosamine/UDP-N-acetylgalactosamine diphosphorylase
MTIKMDKELVCKAVTKAAADEKVGNFCVKDGSVRIVEYDEITPEMQKEKDRNGKLKYNYGSTLCFCFKVSKLLEICQDVGQLNQMYHKHLKKVAMWMEEQQKSEIPEKENAWKFELFIQNCMGYFKQDKFGLLVVDREDEFAPVKNAPGAAVDSPDTARQLLTDLHLKWFSLAGG